MIVGRGDLAKSLKDRPGALFFASGVSDSSCTDYNEFRREMELLLKQDINLCCFYFSSISAFTNNSPYHSHKRRMEALVRATFVNYNIIRLGNITWGINPKTFLNALRAKIAKGEPVEIKDEHRFVIDQKELRLITDNLPLDGRNEISIFGRMAKVKDLL